MSTLTLCLASLGNENKLAYNGIFCSKVMKDSEIDSRLLRLIFGINPDRLVGNVHDDKPSARPFSNRMEQVLSSDELGTSGWTNSQRRKPPSSSKIP